MNAITYSSARANLAETMDKVCRDHAPVIITKKRDAAVVMMSLDDYEALEETAYLMRSPANARRLLKSIDEMQRGKGITKSLEELELLDNA
jgi:antitoxin YefM